MSRYDDSRGTHLHLQVGRESAACGATPRYLAPVERFRRQTAGDRCKRCLRALARRDREFQSKARQGLRQAVIGMSRANWAAVRRGRGRPGDAARAIEREEGLELESKFVGTAAGFLSGFDP